MLMANYNTKKSLLKETRRLYKLPLLTNISSKEGGEDSPKRRFLKEWKWRFNKLFYSEFVLIILVGTFTSNQISNELTNQNPKENTCM